MASKPKQKINLALQGGGSHGAYTWGVLDQILEDGRFEVEGISGTSAGAMNAVVFADGLERGGADGARERLKAFWEAVAFNGSFSPLKRSPVDIFMGNWSLDTSPALMALDMLSSTVSPYDINPLDLNPLRNIIDDEVDFKNVGACQKVKLFLAATNVWTGKVRVFKNPEIDCNAVLASACLPNLFKAVEIEGIPYWDGGYMGNPVLFPFFQGTQSNDVVLVQINPIERRTTPKTAREISNRVDEITFNASLLRELRAIEFVSRLIRQGKLSPDEYADVRMHRIHADGTLKALSASSKLNTEREFIEHLFTLGREACKAWLAKDADHIGIKSNIDLREEIAYSI